MSLNILLRLATKDATKPDPLVYDEAKLSQGTGDFVPGTSSNFSNSKYNNLIPCLHFEHQLGQNAPNFPIAGIAIHNTFYLHKKIDQTSALLAAYCHYAFALAYAIIYVFDETTTTNSFTYVLTGVNVARVRHSDVHAADTTYDSTNKAVYADDPLRESIHLAYRGIRWIGSDGSFYDADRLWGPNTPPAGELT